MALEIRGLKKTYGDFSVSLDFSVEAGETLALVGPSGSGKTTALNLIAGLAAPDSGAVIMDGKDITDLPPWKRNISVVFQDLALFPHLDVGGNIAYGLFIRGIPKSERRRIVEETLEIVRLPGYAKRRIDTLSGGERQRVAIARALAGNPGALLLDEPFSSLDAPLRKSLRREFLEIRSTSFLRTAFSETASSETARLSQSGAPCIFVTHDREEAMMLGNRVALLADGRITESGPGRELLLAPKTERAALFFGAGHVLCCEVLEKRGDMAEVSSPLGILTVPLDAGHIPASPKLFVPGDAIHRGAADAVGGRSFSARFEGALFEGKDLILNFRPVSGTNTGPGSTEPVTLELCAGPRFCPPLPGSELTLWVDQSLLRLVEKTDNIKN